MMGRPVLPAALLLVLFGAAPLAADPAAGPIAREGISVHPRPDTTGVALVGIVRADGFRDGGGLPGAIVEVRQNGRHHQATADHDGSYRIKGLAPGAARLHAAHVAASPTHLDIILPAEGVLVVDLLLERRVLALAPIIVRPADMDPDPVRPSAPFRDAGTRTPALFVPSLEATSGLVESGLTPGLGSRIGGEEPGEADHVLFMRGSTLDSRQIFLDGAPILTPFHLAGLVPSVDANVIGDANLHVGGAPARYDGGLSYVLDVETREPRRDRIRGEVGVDLLAARGSVEIPLGPHAGFLGSVRGLHGGGSFGEEFPYRYRDALLRFGASSPGGRQSVQVTAFRNREGVYLGRLATLTALAGVRETSSMGDGIPLNRIPAPDDAAAWGNEALSVRWHIGGDRSRVEVGSAVTRYEASLPVAWEDPLIARSTVDRFRADLVAEHIMSRSGDASGIPLRVRWGGEVDRQLLSYDLVPLRAPRLSSIDTERTRLPSMRGGVFIEAETLLRDDLFLRAGVRADAFDVDGSVRPTLRASLRHHLTDDAFLTLSVGRFHDVIPLAPIESSGRGIAEVPALGWSPALAVVSADHVVLGLDQALTDEIHVEISGNVKVFESAKFGEGVEPGATHHAQRALRASGTDLRVIRSGERVEGWIGYALTWVWHPEASGADREFAGRHLLSSGFRARFPMGMDLGFTLGYGAGIPLTGVTISPHASEASFDREPASGDRIGGVRTIGNSRPPEERLASASTGNPLQLAREDAFLRVDLDASWRLEPAVAGRVTVLRPYVRVLNALDRRDALFHYFDRWRDDRPRPVANRPILPLVGVEWRF